MKRKILFILLSVVLCLSLVGCGKDEDTDKSSKSKKGEETSEKVSKNTIVFNEEKEFKNMTLKVVEVYLTKDIAPQGATGYYSHYEAKSGEIYFDIVMLVKNTGNKAVYPDELFDIKAKVGSTEYTGFDFLEKNNRSELESYGKIESLATEYVHFAIAVPEDTKAEDIKVEFTIDEKTYKLDGATAIEKTQKVIADSTVSIKDNEKQTVDKIAEFYIEKSEITAKVEPPKAKGYYRYYEADSGKVYVNIIIAYKNLGSTDIECDEILGGAKLIYDNNYEYTPNVVVEEDSRSDITYGSIRSISPLATEYVHYLFEIPESLKNESGPLVFKFRIGEKLFQYSVR